MTDRISQALDLLEHIRDNGLGLPMSAFFQVREAISLLREEQEARQREMAPVMKLFEGALSASNPSETGKDTPMITTALCISVAILGALVCALLSDVGKLKKDVAALEAKRVPLAPVQLASGLIYYPLEEQEEFRAITWEALYKPYVQPKVFAKEQSVARYVALDFSANDPNAPNASTVKDPE